MSSECRVQEATRSQGHEMEASISVIAGGRKTLARAPSSCRAERSLSPPSGCLSMLTLVLLIAAPTFMEMHPNISACLLALVFDERTSTKYIIYRRDRLPHLPIATRSSLGPCFCPAIAAPKSLCPNPSLRLSSSRITRMRFSVEDGVSLERGMNYSLASRITNRIRRCGSAANPLLLYRVL